MLIIETRYKDIPWEEYIVHHTKEWRGKVYSKIAYEREVRGKPVKIQTPASQNMTEGFSCDGPFYLLNPNGTGHEVVCPHLAEIGD